MRLEISFSGGIITRMSQIIEKAVELLDQVLQEKVDPAHGIKHAIAVLGHVDKAVQFSSGPLTAQEVLAIRLAALLHDADDTKFFKDTHNAEDILNSLVEPEIKELTMKMINLVSCSKNGNSVVEPEWLLYPRYADRLEAIGEIGIWRCWQYTKYVDRPLFVPGTKRARSFEELNEIASKDRFEKYVAAKGKIGSSSFIDHFYDKLLHISDLGTNSYFMMEAKKRHRIMEAFLLGFGVTGHVYEAAIEKMAPI